MHTVKFHPQVKLVYTEIGDGNMDKRFSSPDAFKANRKAVFKTLGLNPHQVIEGQQLHNDLILYLDSENIKMWHGQNITGVDGFVTTQSDIFLLLRVADCVPVVIYDPEHHALGVFHAGWRGTVKQIHLKGLNLMVQKFATNPRACLVWLGPSAHACCFSSSEEPAQKFTPVWKAYIRKRRDRWYIDLLGYQVDTLKAAGVFKKNMLIDPRCTVTDPQLFSHLRTTTSSGPAGRFAVIVQLRHH